MHRTSDIFSILPAAIERKRTVELYGDGKEITPPPWKQEQKQQKKKRSILYPICLHTAGDRAPQLIAAYCTESRITYLDTHGDVDTDKLRVLTMKELHISTEDAYWQLVDEANNTILDYQQATGERSLVQSRPNAELLFDTLHNDLSVFHFLVYAAIKSILDYHQAPWVISVAMIERRVLGFTSKKSFDAGYSKLYPVPVRYTKDKIRRATLQLKKCGLLERATVGRWTWYGTRGYMNKRGIQSLEKHALNIALRNKRKAEQLRATERNTQEIYRQEVARMKAERIQQRQAPPAEQAPSPPAPMILPFKLYPLIEIADKRAIRHLVRSSTGERLAVLNQIDKSTQATLRQAGYTVENYQFAD